MLQKLSNKIKYKNIKTKHNLNRNQFLNVKNVLPK
jgi:hypothetical protein